MLSQQAHGPRLRLLLALGDSASLALALWWAHLARFSPQSLHPKWEQLLETPGLVLWAVASCWGLATAAELYEGAVVNRFSATAVRAGAVVVLWSAGLVLASYLWPPWRFGRGLLTLTALFLLPLMLVHRRVLASWLRRRNRRSVLVVGDPATAAAFCRQLETYTSSPWEPVNGAQLPPRAVQGRVEELGARFIVVAGSHPESRADFGTELGVLHQSGVPVVSEVDVWAWFEERLPLDSMSPELALHQHGFGPVHWDAFHRLTGVLDLVLAAVLLVASLPFFALAALAVLAADGAPVIYRQERVGRFGRRFTMLKLRTMRRDAEAAGPSFAADGDPRVTPLGRLLRRLRIDELPQLVNVLRGEMSMVGPRPERPEFVAELARKIPFYTFRLAVRPGLTGWAQVNTAYARDLEGQRRKLEYDLYYVRQPSLRLYLLALLRTASAALVGSRRPAPSASGAPLHRAAQQRLK
ncbi:MAG TPA: exopolysaccharide biosynthesis polyprenyl glycosylphosphotransferase [Thermoanaerobaculia bacterium]